MRVSQQLLEQFRVLHTHGAKLYPIRASENDASQFRDAQSGAYPMNGLEAFVLPLIGAVLTHNAATLDAQADAAADRIISAVKDSETKLDDVAADAVAKLLERIAQRVSAGIVTPLE